MSAKEWGVVALAGILASPILLSISLIIVAVVFIIGYVTLLLFGLVSAVIYAAIGLGLVWLLGKLSVDFLKKYPYIILIVPAMFIMGYIVDHTTLTMLSFASRINSEVSFASMQVDNADYVLIAGPYLVAIVALVVAVLVLALTLTKTKRKYKWVK